MRAKAKSAKKKSENTKTAALSDEDMNVPLSNLVTENDPVSYNYCKLFRLRYLGYQSPAESSFNWLN